LSGVRYRPLGATGITVSEIGVGCSRVGGALTPGGSRQEELAMLEAAADAGITFFDTSDLYSQGQSEVLVGQALRSRRPEVVIATKGGYVVPLQRKLVARLKPVLGPLVRRLRIRRPSQSAGGGGPIAQNFSPVYLAGAVEASLRRLGTDYIDIYQLHSPSRSVVELGDYVAGLNELKAQGKIRHYGIAADDATDVVGFDGHPEIETLQVPFSLLHPQAADELFPKAAERGVGLIARSCYAAGLFKDGLAEDRLRELTADWEQILVLRHRAAQLRRPLLEAALQFSIATPPIAVTIVGMRTPAHVRANLCHYDAAPLAESERAVLTDSAREAP
jgi:aryl-alcohol dehydrogenase-like predicted oxidoreductase